MGLATAEVLARVEFEGRGGMAGYWETIFPGEVPTRADKVLPQLLTTSSIDLEGNELQLIKIGQADTAESTVLHIPSLGAVVTGDVAYNEVHMMTAETGEAERAQWIANLDKVAALKPTFVVAATRRLRTATIPRSSANPNGICAISPDSRIMRPRRPTLSPGCSRSILTGATSARIGIPRRLPSIGKAANWVALVSVKRGAWLNRKMRPNRD